MPAGSDAEFYASLLYGVDMTEPFLSDLGIYISPGDAYDGGDDVTAACAAPDGLVVTDDATFGCREDGERAVYTTVHRGSARATFLDGDVVVSFFWDPVEEVDPAVAIERFGAIVQHAGLDISGLDFASLLEGVD
ncbi:MAG: hypothetical protein Q7V88_11685 [Actinomycetota bacterium]|nr:hypothetical protein [Actinomycetota bacterium]